MSEKNVLVDRWDKQVEITVPDSATVMQAAHRPDHPPLEDLAKAVRQALDFPMGMPSLPELVGPGSKVAIAFDDPLKYGPKFFVVPILLEVLERAWVRGEHITLVSANGTHDRPPKEDFKGLYRGRYPVLPDDVVDKFWPERFMNHDAQDPDLLVDMGQSSLGDLVEHNRILVDSDLVIYSGSVMPLIWGGYSGEGVVVGLGSARSISSHHKFSVIGSEGSTHSDPRTHEFRRHKDAILDRIEAFTGKKIFFINGVPTALGGWAGFFAGHYRAIQEAQWQCADQQHLYPANQADLIIAGVGPYFFYGDTRNPIINMVAVTTIMRSWKSKPILRQGGVVILITKCDGHIDAAKHPSYGQALEWFKEEGSAAAVEEKYFERLIQDENFLRKYHANNAYHPVHPVWLFNENQYALDHAGKIIFATAENPEAPGRIGAEYAANFKEALANALDFLGPNPRILVLPNYFSRIPMIFDVK